MSTLATAVQARYPTQTLVDLTRRKNTASTTPDTTVLELAVDDVTAAFGIYVGVALDTANAKHLLVACDGVLARLKSWTRESPDAAKGDWEVWLASALALAKVTSRDRSPVLTTSLLTPTVEAESGETVRPAFDADAFDGYAPARP